MNQIRLVGWHLFSVNHIDKAARCEILFRSERFPVVHEEFHTHTKKHYMYSHFN